MGGTRAREGRVSISGVSRLFSLFFSLCWDLPPFFSVYSSCLSSADPSSLSVDCRIGLKEVENLVLAVVQHLLLSLQASFLDLTSLPFLSFAPPSRFLPSFHHPPPPPPPPFPSDIYSPLSSAIMTCPPPPPPLASSSCSNESLLLSPALDQLVSVLLLPLLPTLPSSSSSLLRSSLTSHLSALFAPTWQPSDPTRGSAFRTLIATKGRLPRPLREAVKETNVVSLDAWETALGGQEWQAWCDPGRVSWRDGGWEWEDGIFYLGGWKGTSDISLSLALAFSSSLLPPSFPSLPLSPLPLPSPFAPFLPCS